MSHPLQGNNIIIESPWPEIDGGLFPVKREVGDSFDVYADIFKEGHDVLSAALLYRVSGRPEWQRVPMKPIGNDRWLGCFELRENAVYDYTIEAWVEEFETWRRDTLRKQQASQDIASDLLEGRQLIVRLAEQARRENNGSRDPERRTALAKLEDFRGRLESSSAPDAGLLLSDEMEEVSRQFPDLRWACRYRRVLQVICDRVRARYGAWYEMFARSQGTDPTRSATWAECAARLPEIERMGFDVVYLPPIHPIGRTKRKGPNNSLVSAPGDPGSPYAIGAAEGGHDAVEPGLGTLAGFDQFVAAAQARGLEIALDFAINCSPDHPYVKQHPDWFFHRPDGSIKYAENPPKRYEDIYPLNFYTEAWESLWNELQRIIEFWINHGVSIFRVDNPHTKPLPFWHWVLDRVRARYPQAVFLSEAFTRPKVMKYLAKAGFSQSYTYFTWRNTKAELIEYMTELSQSESREYFRPNFFTCTPDILPEILQKGGRPAFEMRFLLAATLAPSYGIYNGFELCENRAVPGTEEYLDSEKYQFKVWDWDRPGNIKPLITRVNQIRREHPALHRLTNIQFLPADNDQVLFYSKTTPDGGDVLLIAVNLDPYHAQEAHIEIPLQQLGIHWEQSYDAEDLLGSFRATWRGSRQWLRLDPYAQPQSTMANIIHIKRSGA